MEDDEDPALEPFLNLLAADIAARSGEVFRPFPETLAGRLEALSGEAETVDLDAPIEQEATL